MANQTLSVRYRPKSFDELIEQSYIKIILENQIKNNDVKNAYLFTGPARNPERLHLQEYLQI